MPNEDQKLDSLCPGSREMERGNRESQNFQPLKEVQHLEEEEEEDEKKKKKMMMMISRNLVRIQLIQVMGFQEYSKESVELH